MEAQHKEFSQRFPPLLKSCAFTKQVLFRMFHLPPSGFIGSYISCNGKTNGLTNGHAKENSQDTKCFHVVNRCFTNSHCFYQKGDECPSNHELIINFDKSQYHANSMKCKPIKEMFIFRITYGAKLLNAAWLRRVTRALLVIKSA